MLMYLCFLLQRNQAGSGPAMEFLSLKSCMDYFKGRLQSLLHMCDRFVISSLLITSFQSHGVNENTRSRLNRSLRVARQNIHESRHAHRLCHAVW